MALIENGVLSPARRGLRKDAVVELVETIW